MEPGVVWTFLGAVVAILAAFIAGMRNEKKNSSIREAKRNDEQNQAFINAAENRRGADAKVSDTADNGTAVDRLRKEYTRD